MKYTIPHYFEQFQCTAAECTDTCCAGWAIMIDEESLEKYKQMDGAFGNRVKNSIDWEKGCFQQHECRCAFLNEDNLCDLHIEAGEQMLCDTCKNYPRHMEEFEGVREGSLSLSCIEAAKIILGCEEPVRFVDFEDEIEDEEYDEFDYLLYTKLVDAREKILKVLQNRDVDIMTRIAVVSKLAKEMQKAVDEEEMFRIDEMLEHFGEMHTFLECDKMRENYFIGENEYCATIRKMFRVLYKLEVLKNDWPDYLKKAEKMLYGNGQMEYERHRKEFHEAMREKGAIWLEQLMIYFVFTYFCGAVYDGNILGKMQTAVTATLLIKELAFAKWLEENQFLNFDMFVDIAHRVSRELEHSDVNLLRLEKIYEKIPYFHIEEFMRVILY